MPARSANAISDSVFLPRRRRFARLAARLEHPRQLTADTSTPSPARSEPAGEFRWPSRGK
jgi:hypothetical protein